MPIGPTNQTVRKVSVTDSGVETFKTAPKQGLIAEGSPEDKDLYTNLTKDKITIDDDDNFITNNNISPFSPNVASPGADEINPNSTAKAGAKDDDEEGGYKPGQINCYIFANHTSLGLGQPQNKERKDVVMDRALNGMEEMHPTRSKDDPKVTIDPEGTAKEESSEMKTKQQRRTLKAKKPLKKNPESRELQQMDIRRFVRSKIDSCAKQEFSPNTTTSTTKGKCKGRNITKSQGSQNKQLSIKGMMRIFLNY